MADRKLIWRYTDLFLSIARNPAGAGYQVRGTLPAKKRDAVATFPSPVSEEDIERLRTALSNPHVGTRGLPKEIGQRLYNAVFSGAVGGLLAVAEAGLRRGQGLRLRFRSGSPEVSEWPFELLHDSIGFLGLRKTRLIVRYLGPPKPMKTLRGPRPLRVLVVVASPKSLDPIDVEQEWREIREALEPLVEKKRVEIERLDNPTLADLENCLASRKFHVLHFIGHGSYSDADAEGFIYLYGRNGEAAPIAGGTLALVLNDFPSMRLVVLNTCEGTLVGGDRFSGVAQNLIRGGIPAVVAMQAKIPDTSAILFSRRFYERLAKGRPIDRAVTRARYALYMAGDGNEADWAIPVLFMGTEDGRLFRWTLRLSWIVLLMLLLAVLTFLWIRPPWQHRCPTPKAVDMELVWIEPTPGSNIPGPFCLGAREVSRGEWEAVLGANSLPVGQSGDHDLPVGVSYNLAKTFIRKLNEKEDKQVYRFPTEAEWAYAALGPGHSQAGNCKGTDDYDGLAPVGSFQTNDWRLYDMVGNVWEWVDAPDATEEKRVRRGAAWDSSKKNCRLTERKLVVANLNWKNTGFRLVREIRR